LPAKTHQLIKHLDETTPVPTPLPDELLLSPDPSLTAHYLKQKGRRELVDELIRRLNPDELQST